MDQQALTYSEIKALCTGDERIKERLMLENDVKVLWVLAAEHRNTVFEMEDNPVVNRSESYVALIGNMTVYCIEKQGYLWYNR